MTPTGSSSTRSGNVTTVTNALVNFGWEYVYHCHILSHEEMDMMRPVLYALPPLSADTVSSFDQATRTLSFNDNSITETSFVVQKSADGTTWTDLETIVSPLDQPNIHQSRTVTDAAFVPDIATFYRIRALNTVGYGGAYPSVTAQSVSAPFLVGVTLPTTTVLTSDVNPSSFGANVTFSATVSPSAATGTVQFTVDGTNVGAPVSLASGVATFSTSTLAAGSHSVVANYGGSVAYAGSNGSMTQVVDLATSTTTLASSLNPSPLGQSVTFSASVAPASATGTVVFTIDGVDGAPVALIAGKATMTTSGLTCRRPPGHRNLQWRWQRLGSASGP